MSADSQTKTSTNNDNDEDVRANTQFGKCQPWKTIWPASRDAVHLINVFGFKKGEMMVFDGNAGNFFARNHWEASPCTFCIYRSIFDTTQVEKEVLRSSSDNSVPSQKKVKDGTG